MTEETHNDLSKPKLLSWLPASQTATKINDIKCRIAESTTSLELIYGILQTSATVLILNQPDGRHILSVSSTTKVLY